MKQFLKKHDKSVSACIISFALGFAAAFFLIELYANRDIVGNYCVRIAGETQKL